MFTGDNTVNFGMSNSLLRPKKHLQLHPTVEFTDTEKVTMIPLDELLLYNFHNYNMIVMDCQGYEGNVLRGGVETLKRMDYVYTEINFDEVYENCTKSAELDELLFEFDRVETGTKVGGMWSDCLYIRKKIL